MVEKKENGSMKKRDIQLITMKPLMLKELMIEMMTKTIAKIEEIEATEVEEAAEITEVMMLEVEVGIEIHTKKKEVIMIKIILVKENMEPKEATEVTREVMAEEEVETTGREIMNVMMIMNTMNSQTRPLKISRSPTTSREWVETKMKLNLRILTMTTSLKSKLKTTLQPLLEILLTFKLH